MKKLTDILLPCTSYARKSIREGRYDEELKQGGRFRKRQIYSEALTADAFLYVLGGTLVGFTGLAIYSFIKLIR